MAGVVGAGGVGSSSPKICSGLTVMALAVCAPRSSRGVGSKDIGLGPSTASRRASGLARSSSSVILETSGTIVGVTGPPPPAAKISGPVAPSDCSSGGVAPALTLGVNVGSPTPAAISGPVAPKDCRSLALAPTRASPAMRCRIDRICSPPIPASGMAGKTRTLGERRPAAWMARGSCPEAARASSSGWLMPSLAARLIEPSAPTELGSNVRRTDRPTGAEIPAIPRPGVSGERLNPSS